MSNNSGSIDDAYFNDLTRQPQASSRNSDSPQDAAGHSEENGAPKTKRIACVICRRRKLKCDGVKPKCATCARLGHDCQYDEVRRKSGPKRGYVKDLEARLAQVETQLNKAKDVKKTKSNEPKATLNDNSDVDQAYTTFHPGLAANMPPRAPDGTPALPRQQSIPEPQAKDPLLMPITGNIPPDMIPDAEMMSNLDLGLDANFSWEMIGLGLEEPMPMQEAIDELTGIYFDKIHPCLPMLHKYRYRSSLDLPQDKRPPICLRYMMWALAAAITDKYMHYHDIFYKRARKYIESDEMKGQGESFVSLAHSQTWSLLATYEFKMMYFPRAWMSVGRAARMVLMLGLNRIDGAGLDVKQCLPPPKDWSEREERRRTFWMAYCVDRYASIGTGWPMTIDEKDIITFLPASEDAYENNKPQKAPTLHDAITPSQVAQLSSFAGVVFVTHFFGLNLTHLHRPEPDQREDDLNGEFWRRHHSMDNNLTQTNIMLPSHLRLPAGARNPNIVFLNFAIHTSTICLHQAAIFKAEKHQLPRTIIEKSRDRCLAAATAIEDVMRQTCHIDVAGMNPFMAFCLYVAARVFVQYIKKNPQDSQPRSALQFLLTAMEAMKLKNPLTESFLVQLHLDIKGHGIDIFFPNPDYSSVYVEGQTENGPGRGDNKVGCSPIINLKDSASPEGQSPEDTRFPNDKIATNRQKTPTLRAESPRQGQYAFRSIDLAARDARDVRPLHLQDSHHPTQLHGIFNADSWNGNNASNAPVGLNPLFNNNISMNGFDTEMSDAQNNSTGLTPQSSYSYNHSSSNTSYSPPNIQDEDPSSTKATTMPPIASTMNAYTSFSPPSDQMFIPQSSSNGTGSATSLANNNAQAFTNNVQTTNGMGQDDLFKNMQGWDMGNSPGPLQGMTPGGEWEKMMDSMGENIGWGMTPGADRNG